MNLILLPFLIVLISLFVGIPGTGWAQSSVTVVPGSTQAAGVSAVSSPVFESQGIRVKIAQASLSKDGDRLNIVAIIENRNDYDLLAAFVVKEPVATDNNGNSFSVNGFNNMNGISVCTGPNTSYNERMKVCLDPSNKDGLPIEGYTTLSKGATVTVVMNMNFNGGDRQHIGDMVSFSSIMAIRKPPQEAAALSSSGEVKIPRATIVTVGVPLIHVAKN